MSNEIPQLQPPFGQREPMTPGVVVSVPVTSPPPQVTYAPVPPPAVAPAPVVTEYDIAQLYGALSPRDQSTLRSGLEAGAAPEEIAKYVEVPAPAIEQMRAAWMPAKAANGNGAPAPIASVASTPKPIASVSKVTKKHREALAQILATGGNYSVETLAQNTGLSVLQVAKELEKLKKASAEPKALHGTLPTAPPHAQAAQNALGLQVGMIISGTPDVVPLEAEMLKAQGFMLIWNGQAWQVAEHPGAGPQSTKAAVEAHVDAPRPLLIEMDGKSWPIVLGAKLPPIEIPTWVVQRAAQLGLRFQKCLDGTWGVEPGQVFNAEKPPIEDPALGRDTRAFGLRPEGAAPPVESAPQATRGTTDLSDLEDALVPEGTGSISQYQELELRFQKAEESLAGVCRSHAALLNEFAIVNELLRQLANYDVPAKQGLLFLDNVISQIVSGRFRAEDLKAALNRLLGLPA